MIKMSEFDPVQDAEMLIGKFIANEISVEEGERLLAFLQANPAWNQKLYEQKRIADFLMDAPKVATNNTEQDPELKSELLDALYQHYEKVTDFSQIHRGRRRFLTILYVVSALAFVLVVTVLVHAYFSVPDFSHPTRVIAVSPFTETSQAVAILSHAIDVKWSKTMKTMPQKGAALIPGDYEFDDGVVMIQFYNGSAVIAQGPCRMQILSATQVACLQGRFSVESRVQAELFFIRSPAFSMITGTQYLLDLSENHDDLYNISGTLAYEKAGFEKRFALEAGEGIRADMFGKTSSLPAQNGRFLSLAAVIELSENNASLNLTQWEESRKRWLEDSSLRLFYDFQSESTIRKSRQLVNRAGGEDDSIQSTLIGGRLGDGRWPGKNSLEFRTVSDRLLVSIPEELTSVTLSVSVRADEIERNLNSIFMTEKFGKGALHWQILNKTDGGERGAVRIGLFEGRPGNYTADNFDSPVVFTEETLGVWVRLAVVLDAENRTVSHYLDGKRLVRHPVPFEMKFDLRKAEIGNWNSDTPKNPIRNFVGGFEELMLFSRALTDEEIHLLHSARP